jgi:hypothetical protein
MNTQSDMKATIFGKKYKPILVDGWNMFTITSDGINPRIYRNGKPLNLVSTVTTGTYVRMYYYPSITVIDRIRAYEQLLDEFMFYQKFLSEQEVKSLWNKGYGVDYASLTTAQKTNLQRYCSCDNTNLDSVTNSAFLGYYLGAFSTNKKLGTHSVTTLNTSSGAITLGDRSYNSLNMSNATQDVAYSMNFWMKNTTNFETLRIYKGLEYFNTFQYTYNIEFSLTNITLTYYSLNSSINKKVFTFSLI